MRPTALSLRELNHHRNTRLDARALDRESRRVVVTIDIGGLIEIREELVVLALRDRLVWMAVALDALKRHAHERLPRRRNAIEDRRHAELFVVGSTFGIRECVAVKRRGDAVVIGRVRQEITRQKPHGEIVVRHVAIQCVDHPIAPSPNVAARVLLVALRVGVTRQIKPDAREALAIGRTRKKCVDKLRVARVGWIREIRRAHGLFRRQAGQVERDATHDRLRVGYMRRLKTRFLEAGEDKSIDVVARPCGEHG